jgi:hypothetical protein
LSQNNRRDDDLVRLGMISNDKAAEMLEQARRLGFDFGKVDAKKAAEAEKAAEASEAYRARGVALRAQDPLAAIRDHITELVVELKAGTTGYLFQRENSRAYLVDAPPRRDIDAVRDFADALDRMSAVEKELAGFDPALVKEISAQIDIEAAAEAASDPVLAMLAEKKAKLREKATIKASLIRLKEEAGAEFTHEVIVEEFKSEGKPIAVRTAISHTAPGDKRCPSDESLEIYARIYTKALNRPITVADLKTAQA